MIATAGNNPCCKASTWRIKSDPCKQQVREHAVRRESPLLHLCLPVLSASTATESATQELGCSATPDTVLNPRRDLTNRAQQALSSGTALPMRYEMHFCLSKTTYYTSMSQDIV